MSLASAVSDISDRPSAPMRGVVKLAAACLLGALVGLFTAYQTVSGGFGIVSQTKGPWTVWPTAGTPQVDPYTRAHFLLAGRLPSSHFETLDFEARTDSEGKALDATCIYAIAVPPPRARWWSLSALSGRADEQEDATVQPSSAMSQEVVRNADGTARLILSPEARPGNWIRQPGGASPVLLYRVYGVEPALRASPLRLDLPSIRREACL